MNKIALICICILMLPIIAVIGSNNSISADENKSDCEYELFLAMSKQEYLCHLEISNQNKVIIEQNIQVLKNQEIQKCYELHKATHAYTYKDWALRPESSMRAEDLIEVCGK